MAQNKLMMLKQKIDYFILVMPPKPEKHAQILPSQSSFSDTSECREVVLQPKSDQTTQKLVKYTCFQG